MDETINILIVEDLPTDAELCEREIKKTLSDCVFQRVDTQEDFLMALKSFQPKLIISDYKMPRFDGMTALTLALKHVPETPFIILTGSMNEETAVECMKAGAWDYVIKEHIRRLGQAVTSALEQKRVRQERKEAENRYRLLFENSPDGVLIIDPETARIIEFNETTCRQLGYSREEFARLCISDLEVFEKPEETMSHIAKVIQQGRDDFETRHRTKKGEIMDVHVIAQRTEYLGRTIFHCVWRDITPRKQAEEHLKQTLERLRQAVGTTIQVMVSAAEIRDPYTAGHQYRVADLARTIATEMKLPGEKIDNIRMAASIHDIGKLSVPAEILSRPTKLSDVEFTLVKEHPRSGYEILKDVKTDYPLAEIVYQHHERLDGSGYPRGLKGEEMLTEARIIAVADVVEAMASHRPYRPALGIDAALEEIEKNKGTLYDADAADACLRLFREKGFKFKAN